MLGEQQINKYSWKNIFNKISFIDMPGDHFSFFEKGTDINFIKEFNERINLN